MIYHLRSTNRRFNRRMKSWRFQTTLCWSAVVVLSLAVPAVVEIFARSYFLQELMVGTAWPIIANWELLYAGTILCFYLSAEYKAQRWATGWLLSRSVEAPVVTQFQYLRKKVGLSETVRICHYRFARFEPLSGVAFWSLTHKGTVLLTGDVLGSSREETDVLIAHELAHLAMGDNCANGVMQACRKAVCCFSIVCFLLLLADASTGNEAVWYLAGVQAGISLLGCYFTLVIQYAHSRVCEYRADAIAIEITTPAHVEHLVSCLKKCAPVPLGMVKEDAWWYSTHPPLAKRIAALTS